MVWDGWVGLKRASLCHGPYRTRIEASATSGYYWVYFTPIGKASQQCDEWVSQYLIVFSFIFFSPSSLKQWRRIHSFSCGQGEFWSTLEMKCLPSYMSWRDFSYGAWVSVTQLVTHLDEVKRDLTCGFSLCLWCHCDLKLDSSRNVGPW